MESTWNFSPININEKDIKALSPENKTCRFGQTIESFRQQIEIMETLRNYVCTETMREDIASVINYEDRMLHFCKVKQSSISALRGLFKSFPSRSCDYSIGGILMWADFFNYEMAIIDSALFIKGYDRESDTWLYYEPLGTIDKGKALSLIEKDVEINGGKAVMITDVETMADPSGDAADGSDGYCDKWMEYLYDIEKFLHFSGKKMEKKRNHLNYFIKHYPDYRIEPITSENTAELIEFTKRFEKNHADSDLFNYESSQTIEVLNGYDAYPFEGLLIRIDGNVVGYTFGEKIGDTFFVHVEKGDIDFQGVYQALASNLAQYVNGKYPEVKYLNREEDMGNEALRKSKESYHPSLLIKKEIHVLAK